MSHSLGSLGIFPFIRTDTEMSRRRVDLFLTVKRLTLPAIHDVKELLYNRKKHGKPTVNQLTGLWNTHPALKLFIQSSNTQWLILMQAW